MGTNLITNGSFEANIGTPPTGWTVAATGLATATAHADPLAFDRSNDVLLTVTAPGEFVRLIQTFSLAGLSTTALHISYALRPDAVNTNGRHSCIVTFRDSAGATLLVDTVQRVAAASLFDPGWTTHVATTSTIPAGADSARFELTLGSDGGNLSGIHLDNVFVTTD